MLESFCFCISLRTGARCVGVINMLVGLLGLLPRAFLLIAIYVSVEDDNAEAKQLTPLVAMVISLQILYSLAVVFFSCLLLRCIFTKNHNGIRYWLYFEIGSLIAVLFANIVKRFLPVFEGIFTHLDLINVVVYAAITLIQIYFIATVYSYYKRLVAEQNVNPLASIQIIGKSKNEIICQDEVKYNRF